MLSVSQPKILCRDVIELEPSMDRSLFSFVSWSIVDTILNSHPVVVLCESYEKCWLAKFSACC